MRQVAKLNNSRYVSFEIVHLILKYCINCFSTSYIDQTTAISLTDSIRRNIDQKMLTGAVFVDLRKAFDTVDHSLLLAKLKHYGVVETELKWFCDYFKNRAQIVNFQNVLSPPCHITSGVPQGSILGPL